jgi:hypothetical protein
MIYTDLKKKLGDIIRPVYYCVKDTIDYKSNQIIKKNAELNNKYLGEKCFLLMSGESINIIDISKLKGQFTFSVNWAFIKKDIMDLPLTFYLGTMFHERFFLKPEIGKIYWPEGWTPAKAHKIIKEKLIEDGTRIFFKADDFRFILRKYKYDVNKTNIHFIKTKGEFTSTEIPEICLNKRFSIFEDGGGSQYTALIMLINMGFKEIYLCGSGYTYSPFYYLHFYDNFTFPVTLGKDKAVIEAQKAIEDRNKRIDSRLEYYGLLKKGDLFRGIYIKRVNEDSPHWKKHRLINKYAKSQGVKIINIIPDGFQSPIYEKVTWEFVMKNIL